MKMNEEELERWKCVMERAKERKRLFNQILRQVKRRDRMSMDVIAFDSE
jgi:hypothetical protein